jgi:hypothetical protein
MDSSSNGSIDGLIMTHQKMRQAGAIHHLTAFPCRAFYRGSMTCFIFSLLGTRPSAELAAAVACAAYTGAVRECLSTGEILIKAAKQTQ